MSDSIKAYEENQEFWEQNGVEDRDFSARETALKELQNLILDPRTPIEISEKLATIRRQLWEK